MFKELHIASVILTAATKVTLVVEMLGISDSSKGTVTIKIKLMVSLWSCDRGQLWLGDRIKMDLGVWEGFASLL